jgi:hypothetical protein
LGNVIEDFAYAAVFEPKPTDWQRQDIRGGRETHLSLVEKQVQNISNSSSVQVQRQDDRVILRLGGNLMYSAHKDEQSD